MRKVLSLVGGLLISASATATGNSTFICPATAVTCYYTILYASGGYRNITIKGGETDSVSGTAQGDTYCVSYSGIPDEKTCKATPVPTH